MSFLPNGYDVPKTPSNYMKLEQGENKFRVLSEHPVLGFEYWTNEKKPVRSKEIWQEAPNDIKIQNDKSWQQSVKHFWAFVIWNYKTENIEILEITQKSIQGALSAIFQSEEWGHPSGYDVSITRSGEGMDTEYIVNPKPPKPLDPFIAEMFKDKKINLEALFESGDPFAND